MHNNNIGVQILLGCELPSKQELALIVTNKNLLMDIDNLARHVRWLLNLNPLEPRYAQLVNDINKIFGIK